MIYHEKGTWSVKLFREMFREIFSLATLLDK